MLPPVTFHKYALPVFDVKYEPVVYSQGPGLPVIAGFGNGITVMVTELEFLQPFTPVSVSVYVVDNIGDTVGFDEVELNPDGLLVQE
jgi:hypothetical protein